MTWLTKSPSNLLSLVNQLQVSEETLLLFLGFNCLLFSVKEAAGFLRIGSLNVKVRKTTEAFNNLLSREVESKLHRSWGSSDSIPDAVSPRRPRYAGSRKNRRCGVL